MGRRKRTSRFPVRIKNFPVIRGETIEDVLLEGVSVREKGVEKISGRVVAEADFFHDAARFQVVGDGDGDDLFQSELLEAVVQRRPRGFGGVALAPVIRGQPPADFDARGEVGFEAGDTQADESDELRPAPDFDSPEAEAPFLKMSADAGGHFIALFARQESGEELHDAGIGVEGRERFEVVVGPFAEEKAWGLHGAYK